MRFNELLTEGVKDEVKKMFSDVPNIELLTVDGKQFVKEELKWARETFNNSEQIIWWMRIMKYNALHLLKGNLTDQEEQYQQMIDKLKNKFKSKGFSLESLDYGTVRIQRWKNQFEHFMSLPIHQIQNMIFGWTNPREIFSQMEELEQEWKEKQDRRVDIEGTEQKLIDFKDGFAWYNLGKPQCDAEGRAMGHCGNAGNPQEGDRVLSLRQRVEEGGETYFVPYLTFILSKRGRLGEMKGRGNDKPSEKYHKYIIPLLMSDIIKGIQGGGYLPENNFSLDDLPPEQKQQILEKKPVLGSLEDRYKAAKGVITPDIEEDVGEILEREGMDYQGYEKGKGFHLETISFKDYVEDYGGNTAEFAYKVLTGEDMFDFDSGSFEDTLAVDILDRIKKKNSDIFKKIQEYLYRNYRDDFDEHDIDDPRDLIQVIDENNDDLETAFDIAINDGYRLGAEAEMAGAFQEWTERPADGLYVEFPDYHSEAKIFLDEGDMINLISENSADQGYDMFNSMRWERVLGEYFHNGIPDLEQPYYGWSGYDEDSAYQYFIDFYKDYADLEESIELNRIKELALI